LVPIGRRAFLKHPLSCKRKSAAFNVFWRDPVKLPHRRQFLHLAAGAAAMPALPHIARAQAYPTRPVHILVGLAAGGPTDTAARVMAEWLSQQFKQQFIVENRTGMGGNLANQAVFSSPPDGHTLVFTGPNSTISAALYKKLPFNLLQDSVAVGSMTRLPNIMVVPASLPIKTVKEFIDYAKAHPGELSMASSGVGASPHLSGELFKFMTNIDMVHVPYRGSAAAYPDLISGKVHLLFDNLGGPVLQLMHSGQLRALGVTSASRWGSLPDMPAIAETVPGYEVVIWYGMLARRNTPSDIVEALNRSINAALSDPKVLAHIVEGGGQPMRMTTAEFGKFIRDDVEKWRKVVEFAKISAD
jgi:tripartite-type tricarboxylate transporter receptor subunit TctC